ncbi:phosphotransferase [Bryobacter aggregatus]
MSIVRGWRPAEIAIPHEMVSCHNDLKPENVLFNGRRVSLVDWQPSFC